MRERIHRHGGFPGTVLTDFSDIADFTVADGDPETTIEVIDAAQYRGETGQPVRYGTHVLKMTVGAGTPTIARVNFNNLSIDMDRFRRLKLWFFAAGDLDQLGNVTMGLLLSDTMANIQTNNWRYWHLDGQGGFLRHDAINAATPTSAEWEEHPAGGPPWTGNFEGVQFVVDLDAPMPQGKEVRLYFDALLYNQYHPATVCFSTDHGYIEQRDILRRDCDRYNWPVTTTFDPTEFGDPGTMKAHDVVAMHYTRHILAHHPNILLATGGLQQAEISNYYASNQSGFAAIGLGEFPFIGSLHQGEQTAEALDTLRKRGARVWAGGGNPSSVMVDGHDDMMKVRGNSLGATNPINNAATYLAMIAELIRGGGVTRNLIHRLLDPASTSTDFSLVEWKALLPQLRAWQEQGVVQFMSMAQAYEDRACPAQHHQ